LFCLGVYRAQVGGYLTPGTNLTEKQIQGLIGCAQDAGLKLRTFTLWRLALSVEASKDNTKDSVDNTDLIIADMEMLFGYLFKAHV